MSNIGSVVNAYSSRSDDDLVVDDDPVITQVGPGAAGGPAAPAKPRTQPGIASFFTLTPREQRPKEKAAEKRAEKRQREAAAAVANPTVPGRAAHIDKARVVRIGL